MRGLKAARQAAFGGVPWQRCQFHLQQNAQAYVPRKEMQAEIAADTPGGTIFNAPDRATADQYLARIVQKYAFSQSRLASLSACREDCTKHFIEANVHYRYDLAFKDKSLNSC